MRTLQSFTKLYKYLHNSTILYKTLQNFYNTLHYYTKSYNYTKFYKHLYNNFTKQYTTLQHNIPSIRNLTRLLQHLSFLQDYTNDYKTIRTLVYNTLQYFTNTYTQLHQQARTTLFLQQKQNYTQLYKSLQHMQNFTRHATVYELHKIAQHNTHLCTTKRN